MLQVLEIKRQADQAGHTITSACLWGFPCNILMNRIAVLLFENMVQLLSMIATSLKSIQFYCKICILSNNLYEDYSQYE